MFIIIAKRTQNLIISSSIKMHVWFVRIKFHCLSNCCYQSMYLHGKWSFFRGSSFLRYSIHVPPFMQPHRANKAIHCPYFELGSACYLPLAVSCLDYSSTLKKEATCYYETSGDFQRTTRRYIAEDRNLNGSSPQSILLRPFSISSPSSTFYWCLSFKIPG
jgi:hypothetical protein